MVKRIRGAGSPISSSLQKIRARTPVFSSAGWSAFLSWGKEGTAVDVRKSLTRGAQPAILGMHVRTKAGAGTADGSTRHKERQRSQGAKKADAHVSARIAPGRRCNTSQTPACAPGSRQAVLQCAALPGAAPPAPDAS